MAAKALFVVALSLCVAYTYADCRADWLALTATAQHTRVLACAAAFPTTAPCVYGTNSFPGQTNALYLTSNTSTSPAPCCNGCTPCTIDFCKTNNFTVGTCAPGVPAAPNVNDQCCPTCLPSSTIAGSSTGTSGGTTGTDAKSSTGGSTASCLGPAQMTTAQQTQCLTHAPPLCAAGQTQSFSYDTCCVTCRNPETHSSSTGAAGPVCISTTPPPPCASGVVPTIGSNGCQTCVRTEVSSSGCSYNDTRCASMWSTLPWCSAGVLPTINHDTCCYLCRPQPVLTACTAATENACVAAYLSASATTSASTTSAGVVVSLPMCAAGTTPTFDAATCCRSCVVSIPAAGQPTSGVCTLAAFQACVAASPTCATGETATIDLTKSCCASCVRPERACDVISVAKCMVTLPTCDAGETPQFVDGCCPTCKWPRPTCTPACTSTQLCINHASANASLGTVTLTPGCHIRRDLKYIFTASGTLSALFASMTADQIRAAVAEYIARQCEHAEYVDVCLSYADAIRDIIIAITIDCSKNGGSIVVGGDVRADGTVGADGIAAASATVSATVTADIGCAVRVFISISDDSATSNSATGQSSNWFKLLSTSPSTSSDVVTGTMSSSDSEANAQGLSAQSVSTTNNSPNEGARATANRAAVGAAVVSAIAAMLA